MNKFLSTIAVIVCAAAFTSTRAQEAPAFDPAELAGFVDGLVAAHLEAYHTAGAVAAVVKDGAVVYKKGHGYADVEAKRKVDPDGTLFRIGSVSKLFVWTALMQLWEQGKVDLDADVNTYLQGFSIPATFDEPITLTHLLTHTPGFEDNPIGLFARSAEEIVPLGELLANDVPARVRPPGKLASYSNYGAALAAHIVELVSGQEWNDYVEQHIYTPLGMAHTTFRQPVPADIADASSPGYVFAGGVFKKEEFEYIPMAPAGSVSATAADMTQFMLAHLNNGALGDVRILETSTAQTMHSDLYQAAPKVNAAAHGFYTASRNGHRIIGHGGDTLLFHSLLALFPDDNLGFFVSYNSQEGGQAAGKFFEAFVDHYFPAADPDPITPAPGFAYRAAKYTGGYQANRYSHSNFTNVIAIFSAVPVRTNEDKTGLVINAGERKEFIEVEPLLFREKDGPDYLAFRENAYGKVTDMFLQNPPVIAFEKVGFWGSRNTHLVIFGGSILVFLLTVIVPPVRAILRSIYDADVRPGDQLPLAARLLAWSAALLFLVFYVGMVVSLPNPGDIVFGVPSTLRALLYLLPIAALMSAGVVGYTLFLWGRLIIGQDAPPAIGPMLRYPVIALACAATTWQLFYWHFLLKPY